MFGGPVRRPGTAWLRRATATLLPALLVAAISVSWPVKAGAEQSEAADPTTVNLERRLALGGLHTCVLLDNGVVQCWGANTDGQLGNGTVAATTVPLTVAGITTAVAITAGNTHTCALLHDTTVACWGLDGSGQLGDGTTGDPANQSRLSPVPVVGLTGVTAVAAGGFHTCALVADGSVWCWGSDGTGQLGDNDPGTTKLTPVAVQGIGPAAGNQAVAISAGEFHTCALLAGGHVMCWGHNGAGQLGDGSMIDRPVPTLVGLSPAHAATAVTTGDVHTCAMLDNATTQCWGDNVYGELGHPTAVDSTTHHMVPSATPLTVQYDTDPLPGPTHVSLADLSGFKAVSSGQYHTCALMADQSVACWGNNHRAQLGADPNPLTSTLEDAAYAVPVVGLAGPASAVGGGGFHSCALLSDGTLQCWGYDFYGQLGSFASQSPVPVTVTALSGVTTLAAGTGFACALVSGAHPGQPECWGDNSNGRLGAGLAVANSTIPVQVTGIPSAAGIDAGNGQACVLPSGSQTPSCWGLNNNGQVGDGTTTDRPSPVSVSGLTTATAISAGGAFSVATATERAQSCARAADGTARCWGRNGNGQLGDGTTTDRPAPVTVQYNTTGDPAHVVLAALTNVVTVTTGGFHSCATTTDGRIWCWGLNNAGQLGDNTTTERHYAAPVQGITTAVSIAAGAAHTCAILGDGSVNCWGDNTHGQVGDGSTTARHVPVVVTLTEGFPPATAKATAITAGDGHTCALLDNTSLRCWGANGVGQIGDGTNTDRPNPTAPSGLGDPPSQISTLVTSVSAGRSDTCAALIDTTASCWGDNSHGQLGDGVGTTSLRPLTVVDLAGSLHGNHLPNAVNDSATTTPGVPTAPFNVLANDSDPDGTPLTAALATNPAHGAASVAADGTTTYTPNPTPFFCGTDTFTYTASDGIGAVPATVTVTVTCPNRPPILASDTLTTLEDTPGSVNVLANDTDPDGDPLTAALATPAVHGVATVDPGGLATYTPAANFCGPDGWTYQASDGHGHTVVAGVTVTVTCVNDPPTAVNDLASTSAGVATNVNVLANDTDPDLVYGDTLHLAGVTPASHGTAVPAGNVVSYTPAAGYCGPDTFGYTVSDSHGATSDATVTMSVLCTNQSPHAVDDFASTVEDTPVGVHVLANDTDPNALPLTVIAASDPPHGATSVDPSGSTVTYAPDPGFCGSDTWTYQVSNGSFSAVGTVTMAVTCVNHPPTPVDDTPNVIEDTPATIPVLANDTDPDGGTITLVSVTAPAHGTASVVSGAVSYVPSANYCGADLFSYNVVDAQGAGASAQVFVNVVCVNDPPVIAPVAPHTQQWGDTLSVALSAADPDVGDTLTFSKVSGPAGATVSDVGALSWTPDSADIGQFTVGVQVKDASGATSATSFPVTVTPRAQTVVYTGATTGQYSDAVALSAKVTDTESGDVLPTSAVTFTIGSLTANAGADGTGVASTSLILTSFPTSTSVMATAATPAYTPASDTKPFQITKESATVTYAGSFLSFLSGSSISVPLTATVVEQADGNLGSDLASSSVTFTQVGGPVLCSGPVVVTGAGQGKASCMSPSLGTGSRAVIASLSGRSYSAPVDVGVFTIALTLSGTASGGGQVGAGATREDFGFQAVPQKKGPPVGDATDVFRPNSGIVYVVHSSTPGSLTTSCTSKPRICTLALAAGSATTTAVALVTGATSAIAGTSLLQVNGTDVAEPVGGSVPPDKYAVAITGGTPHQLGTASAQLLISAGNIRVS